MPVYGSSAFWNDDDFIPLTWYTIITGVIPPPVVSVPYVASSNIPPQIFIRMLPTQFIRLLRNFLIERSQNG